jgi:hypothetical protein
MNNHFTRVLINQPTSLAVFVNNGKTISLDHQFGQVQGLMFCYPVTIWSGLVAGRIGVCDNGCAIAWIHCVALRGAEVHMGHEADQDQFSRVGFSSAPYCGWSRRRH